MRTLKDHNFEGIGINGKNSEFHAAMGLCILPEMGNIIQKRKEVSLRYKDMLSTLKVNFPKTDQVEDFNYAYFPLIFESEEQLVNSIEVLEQNGIGSRRYFYPSLNQLDYTSGTCPIAEEKSKSCLCLPLYHNLKAEKQRLIARLLLRGQNN